MTKTNKHHIDGSYDTLSNRMKDRVVVLEGTPDSCVEDECRFHKNINIFLYSLLRVVSWLNLNIELK